MNLRLWVELQETSRRDRASRILCTPPTDSLEESVAVAPLLLGTRLPSAGGETADRAASPGLAEWRWRRARLSLELDGVGRGLVPPTSSWARKEGPQGTSPGVVAVPRPMSAQGAAMEPGAARSTRDPLSVWPRALGVGQGAAESWCPMRGMEALLAHTGTRICVPRCSRRRCASKFGG